MAFFFEGRPSGSPFVEAIWRTESEGGGSFTSLAESHWGIVVTRQVGSVMLTVRGPETKAAPAPIPVDAEFFGISFKLGTFMPHLPARNLVDGDLNLPEAARNSFWLHGAAWEFPDYDNADTFVERLVRDGLLVRDNVVHEVLQAQPQTLLQAPLQTPLQQWSIRTVRRRFLHATGLTYKAIQQIERARQASTLLQQGVPILDTVYEAGYFDQSHMTKALKYLLGQTPAQILRLNDSK